MKKSILILIISAAITFGVTQLIIQVFAAPEIIRPDVPEASPSTVKVSPFLTISPKPKHVLPTPSPTPSPSPKEEALLTPSAPPNPLPQPTPPTQTQLEDWFIKYSNKESIDKAILKKIAPM